MIAESFLASKEARDADFSTNEADSPLICQFAAKDPIVLAQAASVVSPHIDAIDINCGCPQKWAMADGYGSALLTNPELIRDMVKQCRNIADTPCSIKIRLDVDMKLEKTVNLMQQSIAAGVEFITLHGRTPTQRSSTPPDLEAVKTVREALNGFPVIFNGDIFTLEDAKRAREITGCPGIMSARGLLQNPALFAGFDRPPLECILAFIEAVIITGSISFVGLQHHVIDLLSPFLSRSDVQELASTASAAAIVDFLNERGMVLPMQMKSKSSASSSSAL